jgi:hypothetical protein
MRVFKNIWFTRFAKKESISDEELRAVVDQLETGLPDAALGGDVYKVRLARQGEGKSGGYRLMVLFRTATYTFFVYGFAKSDMANIGEKQLRYYKTTTKYLFALNDAQLDVKVADGTLKEI